MSADFILVLGPVYMASCMMLLNSLISFGCIWQGMLAIFLAEKNHRV